MKSVDDFVQAIHEPPPPGNSRGEVPEPDDKPVIWGAPASLDSGDAGSRLGIDSGEPSIKAACLRLLETGDPALTRQALYHLGTSTTKEAFWGGLAMKGIGLGLKGVGKAGLAGGKLGLRAGKLGGKAGLKGGKLAWKGLSSRPGQVATGVAGAGAEASYLHGAAKTHGVGRHGTQLGARRGFFG